MIDTLALKTSIIDLAVSGRLSSRFHASDSVSDILAALPEASVKRKKLLGQVFEYGNRHDIPAHWKWIRLGEIASYGDTPTKAYFDDVSGDTWILDLEDIKSGGNILAKTRVQGKKFVGDKTVFKAGQVLYSKLRPYLKKVLVADEDGVSTPELISFDTFGGILPQYIVYCLLSSFTDRAIDKRSYGIKMPRVDAGFMVNLPIPLPPVSEQHFIVERIQSAFSALDTIDALQAKYADNLAVLKSKLIDAAIQGKLTDQLPEDGTAEELYRQIQAEKQALIKAGKIKKEKPPPEITADEIPFDIPKSWKWARLGNLMLDVSTGPFGSMLHESDYCEGGIPLVNPMHIQNGAIHPSDKMRVSPSTLERLSQYRLSEGMIVVARRGDLGRCARIGKSENGWICGTGCFFLNPSRHVFSPFITLVISSPFARSVFKGTAIGTTMANLNHNLLKGLPFPLPPLAEQKRIVERVSELLTVCDELKIASKRMEL